MFNVFLGRGFLIFLILCAGSANAQVYLSEYARQGIENFEYDRPEFCFQSAHELKQLILFRNGDPAFEPVEGFDYASFLGGPEGWEKAYSFYCGIQYIAFIKPEVEKVCPLENLPDNRFCKTYETFHNSKRDMTRYYFEESFEKFGNEKIDLNWIVSENPEAPSGHSAIAFTKWGNVNLFLSFELVEIKKTDSALKEFNLKEIVLIEPENSMNQDKVYFPLFSVLGLSIGLTDDFFDAEFVATGREETPLGPFQHLGWRDLYFFETPLTGEVLELLFSAEKLSYIGRYTNEEELIFAMDVDNSGFSDVYNILMPIFTEYVSKQEKAN